MVVLPQEAVVASGETQTKVDRIETDTPFVLFIAFGRVPHWVCRCSIRNLKNW